MNVATRVACTTIPPSVMVLNADLLVGALEVFLADVARILGVDPHLQELRELDAFLVVIEHHRLFSKCKHVFANPVHTPLPYQYLNGRTNYWMVERII